MDTSEGADRVMAQCAGVTAGERVVVLRDESGDEVLAQALRASAQRLGAQAEVRQIDAAALSAQAAIEGLPADLLTADLLVGVTSASLYHSVLGRTCAAGGGRVLAMTGCDAATMTSGAIEADFTVIGPQARALGALLDAASTLRVTTRAGTDLTASIAGRPGEACPGIADQPGDRTGFPDVEGFVAPVENTVEGVLVADISTTSLGLVRGALVLEVHAGRVTDIGGDQAQELRDFFAQFGEIPLVVAEFGFGLNPSSHLVGKIIEDEGRLGTGHVALGNNLGFGGTSEAPFHEDFVYWHPTLELDGRTVIDEGTHRWLAR